MNDRGRDHGIRRLAALLCAALALYGCHEGSPPSDAGTADGPDWTFTLAGRLEYRDIDEASGLQAGYGGVLFVHNDDGAQLFAIDAQGRHLGAMPVEGASNRDWEDLARVPSADGPLLVIGDIGDNLARRKRVSLYFLPEPASSDLGAPLQVRHRLRLTYPDGPRDVESLAYDPSSGYLLLLSKRDNPPRLYGVPLDLALWSDELEAELLGEMPGLRPPTRSDLVRSPTRGLWVSQPTGMDISPDGRRAAVITYRSLYLFERSQDQGWAEAFAGAPREILGPPGLHDEAVAFGLDGQVVYVAAEGRPAPLHRLDWISVTDP